jgi:hypothetical protein
MLSLMRKRLQANAGREPDESLATARRALFAGMCAMADSLAVHCPPEKPIHFHWPDAMLFDHGLIGGARIAWPKGTAEDQPPEWLVFAGMIRTAVIRNRENAIAVEPTESTEPGTWSVGTSLGDEGFEDIEAGAIIESFARHLMLHVNAWSERGFHRVGREWLARLPEDKTLKRGLDGNGDLLTHSTENTSPAERRDLVSALAELSWYNPETQEPKL